MLKVFTKLVTFIVNIRLFLIMGFIFWLVLAMPLKYIVLGVLCCWLERCRRTGVYKW